MLSNYKAISRNAGRTNLLFPVQSFYIVIQNSKQFHLLNCITKHPFEVIGWSIYFSEARVVHPWTGSRYLVLRPLYTLDWVR